MTLRGRRLCSVANIAFCLLFFGCSTNETPAFVTEPPAIHTALPSTSTLKPSTPTPTSTKILPTSTWMDVPPTATATLTPAPSTLTPGPTIAAELVQDFLIDLYQKNAGCQLPCWWGFTPGSTTWQEVEAFYKRFNSELIREQYIYSKKKVEIYASEHPLDGTGVHIWEVYTVKNSKVDSIVISGNTVKNDQIIEGDLYYNKIFSNYQMSDILSNYGIPDNVWVSTFPGAPEGGNIPYYLIVEYNQLGISGKFTGNVRDLGSIFNICPQKVDVKLLLWSVEYSDTAILEVLRDYAFTTTLDFREYKSLQSAFEIDPQQFYDLFKISGNQNCLSTDPDDWDF